MRLLIVGDGKMGRAVAALAATRGHAATIIGREENAQGRGLTAERVRIFEKWRSQRSVAAVR